MAYKNVVQEKNAKKQIPPRLSIIPKIQTTYLIMFNYDEDNNVNLRYIECKQTVPTFNNSPPKCEDHIMYVCGNDCYSGCSLICKDDYDRHLDFVERYRELCAEYTESNKALKFVPYKKIELKKFPPDCYDAEKNMELILKSFSDF